MKNALEVKGLTTDQDLATLGMLVSSLGNPRVVEVGSWLGRTAMALYQAGAIEVHCVDRWDGGTNTDDIVFKRGRELGQDKVLDMFRENIGELLNNGIFMYVGDSLYWAKQWEWQADLIFIDSDHRYESVLADINAWTPHIRSGGILCGHDYSTAWPGVIRAVDETGGIDNRQSSLWWRRIT